MKIRKITICVTLLMHESDEDRLSTMSLARIGEEIDFGDMVGTFAIASSESLSSDGVAQELLALGNDGTFFGEPESDDAALDLARGDSAALPVKNAVADDVSDSLQPEIGTRVRIRPRQRIGGDRYANREGIIVRQHFAGFYVRLDMTARERSQKTELVETGYIEVLSAPEQPCP